MLEVKIKLLVFFFVPLVMQKVQKVESIYIQSIVIAKQQAKREQAHSVYLHVVENVKRRVLIHGMVRKQQVKMNRLKESKFVLCVL